MASCATDIDKALPLPRRGIRDPRSAIGCEFRGQHRDERGDPSSSSDGPDAYVWERASGAASQIQMDRTTRLGRMGGAIQDQVGEGQGRELHMYIRKEPTYPPLPPVLQKQVDDYLEKEKKMKEEQQEKEKVDREVYKNINV